MSDKVRELVDMMAGAATSTAPVKCPKCEAEFGVALGAVCKPHKMTVRYQLAEGHKMMVEEFTASITGLSKAIKTIGREMGVKVQVVIDELEATESSVSVTIAVAMVTA